MIFYKLALLWTISICNNINISKSFVVSPTYLIEPKFSTQQSPVRHNKNGSSDIPTLTITTVSASPVSFISLEKCDNPPSSLNSQQRETMLNEALGSNSTAASLLLREINDVSENGSIEDQLLHLVDGSSDFDDHGEYGNDLPAWTKVRILAKFSKRARRASLRRVLDSADGIIDDNDDGGRSRRRKALVFVLRCIARSMLSDGDKARGMKSGSSGSSGIAIWNIERDTRKGRNNAALSSQDVLPGLEKMDFEAELYSSLEDYATADEAKEEKVEEWKNSVPMDKPPVVTEGLSQQKFEEDSKVLALSIEQKIEAITTEQARVQAIKEANQQLEAKRDKDAVAAAAARATEQARVQAINDRHQQLEAEREIEAAVNAAEQAKLQLITNERNQRSILISRLERDAKVNAKEKADRERKAAAATAAAARATEQARVRAINDRHQQLEVERKRDTAVKAAEQEKLRLIVNERNQRSILISRLALDAKDNAKDKTDRERKVAAAARAAERARVQAISDRHQQLETERGREAAARANEQAKLQFIANERNQRSILISRLELDTKLSDEKKAKKEEELAAKATSARAAEQESLHAINERDQQLEVEEKALEKREVTAVTRASKQASMQAAELAKKFE